MSRIPPSNYIPPSIPLSYPIIADHIISVNSAAISSAIKFSERLNRQIVKKMGIFLTRKLVMEYDNQKS